MSNSPKDTPEKDVELKAPPGTSYAYPDYVHPEVLDAQAKDVFWCLVALRVVNALTISTFFQPDEYYQSLEPAWQTVFGQGSGAWITWVRKAIQDFPMSAKVICSGMAEPTSLVITSFAVCHFISSVFWLVFGD